MLPKMAAPLDRVKALLAALPRQDQEDLTRFLHDILFTPEEAESKHVAILREERGGKPVTYVYREEYVRCGKKGCRCGRGERHGPYTYKYWREGARVRKAYVGKGAARPRSAAATGGRARGGSAASRSGPASPA